MRMPMRGVEVTVALACALALGGCVPIAIEPEPSGFSPPAEVQERAEQSREVLSYEIDLPSGWSDLTEEYFSDTPESVLAGFWSMDTQAYTDLPFATVSLNYYDPEKFDPDGSEASAEGWAEDMDDPRRGDSGYAETQDGGVITWASVTGSYGEDARTIHTAHLYYGPYYMYIVVDAPAGDEVDSHALLNSLQSVRISGPIELGDRAGAPVPRAGRWASYCTTLEAEAQGDWQYVFTPYYDGTLWNCPEAKDYLGHWEVDAEGATFSVEVDRIPNTTLDAHLAALGVAGAVGERGETINGYPTEVLAKTAFDAPSGIEGVVIDAAVTVPGGTRAAYSRSYMFEDSTGGVVSVFVSADDNAASIDTAWLEPFIATITTQEVS